MTNKNLDFSAIHNLPDNVGLSNTKLKDGEHVIVKCRICNFELADLWITRPDKKNINSEVVAKCDNCGDKSFITEIIGGYHTGGTEQSDIADIIYDDVVSDGNGNIKQKVTIITKRR